MSRAAAEADRRIGNVLQIGTVVSVDPSRARARVRLGSVEVPNVPVGQFRAGGMSFWWMPEEGEQVMVGAPGGDLAQAVVMSSIFAGNAPSSDPGTPMVELKGGNMIFKGTLIVEGDVIASGISLVNHTHSGVESGPSSTGEPQ